MLSSETEGVFHRSCFCALTLDEPGEANSESETKKTGNTTKDNFAA